MGIGEAVECPWMWAGWWGNWANGDGSREAASVGHNRRPHTPARFRPPSPKNVTG